MPFVQGYLRIRSGAHPDHELPPGEEGPVDPGWGVELPIGPDQGLPAPPPGVWPPPVPAHPIVPAPPDTPPGAVWPPPGPSHPWLPPTGAPGEPAHPIEPVGPGPSHPIALPPDKFWIVAGIPGYGWRYVCVQPQPGHPIEPVGPGVSHPIAPPSGPAPTPHR